MLHIILLILKILGIMIASILGILLLIVLLILLVPIRYSASAEWYDKLEADVKVGWLFRLLYLRILFLDNTPIIRFKIFGITIKDSTKPEKERKPKKNKKGRKKRRRKAETDSPRDAENADLYRRLRDDIIDEDEILPEEMTEKPEQNLLTEKIKDDESSQTQQENNVKKKNDDTSEEKSASNKGFWNKVKNIPVKIKVLFEKIKAFFQNIKNKIIEIIQKKDNLSAKVDLIKEFFSEERNQSGMKAGFGYIWKITKHILPTKIRGYVKFGTGDPCSTGQILGVLALLLPVYKDSLKVVPDFENGMIEGDIFLKGRIRFMTLLIICIKLLLNKACRQLYKNYLKLKEEL